MTERNQRITLFWYSQTGHSFSCARRAERMLVDAGNNVHFSSIFNTNPPSYAADLFLFVFPVYCFTVPVAMRDFINRMPIMEEQKEALAIITCAGAPANTVSVLKNALKKKNIRLRSHVIMRCRDSFIPFAKWFAVINAKNKPDAASYARVDRYLEKHVINGSKTNRVWRNPLSLFHWIGVAAPDNGPKLFLGKRIFHQDKCVKCGFCSALCPSGAIVMKGGEVSYSDKPCIGCCGCINICPENAWETSWFNKKYYNKGKYVRDMAMASGKWKMANK